MADSALDLSHYRTGEFVAMLDVVKDINKEHEEVTKGESAALTHAIKCGKLLKFAKETEKGTWGAFLKNHTKIPQRTASLYMRLADNESEIAEATSIRDAIEKLGKTREGKPKSEPAKPGGSNAVMLNNSPPDKIAIAMRDAGVHDKVRDKVFEDYDAKQLSALLLKEWKPSELKQLVNLLIAGIEQRQPQSARPLQAQQH